MSWRLQANSHQIFPLSNGFSFKVLSFMHVAPGLDQLLRSDQVLKRKKEQKIQERKGGSSADDQAAFCAAGIRVSPSPRGRYLDVGGVWNNTVLAYQYVLKWWRTYVFAQFIYNYHPEKWRQMDQWNGLRTSQLDLLWEPFKRIKLVNQLECYLLLNRFMIILQCFLLLQGGRWLTDRCYMWGREKNDRTSFLIKMALQNTHLRSKYKLEDNSCILQWLFSVSMGKRWDPHALRQRTPTFAVLMIPTW